MACNRWPTVWRAEIVVGFYEWLRYPGVWPKRLAWYSAVGGEHGEVFAVAGQSWHREQTLCVITDVQWSEMAFAEIAKPPTSLFAWDDACWSGWTASTTICRPTQRQKQNASASNNASIASVLTLTGGVCRPCRKSWSLTINKPDLSRKTKQTSFDYV